MTHTGKSSRSILATVEGLDLLQEARVALGEDGKPLSFKKLGEKVNLNEKTVEKFFKRVEVDKSTAKEICKRLNLAIEQVVNPEDLYRTPVSQLNSKQKQLHEFWQKCQTRLVFVTNDLITNLLTNRIGITYEIDDLYIDLRLENRKHLTKYKIDSFSGSRLYLSEEPASQKFDTKEFFQEILKPRLNFDSYRKPIAIIGEFGAGKSIFLRKVGEWIFSIEESKKVAIWVSMRDVGTRNLREYLLEDWLRDVVGELEPVAPKWKSVLKDLLKMGQVWLLLDGVEEIGEQSLMFLAKQLQEGWMRNVQVVLTCRLHFWDSNYNVLADKSETYRILPLSYGDSQTPNQVAQLSDNFFRTPPSPNLVKNSDYVLSNFYSEYYLEGLFYDDLKDFVTNPLRLVMLCYTWKFWEGNRNNRIPKINLELFHGFVEQFYDLQQPKFLVNARQRRELNLALGQLALWAFDQPTSGLLIRLDQIPKSLVQTLGYVDEAGSLLHLALELGLFIPVGLAAESPNERVYAFFHPTFQAYFAAITIPAWHVFFRREDLAHALAGKINLAQFEHYPFLNPRWLDVILLWLEREDISSQEQVNYPFSLADLSDKFLDLYSKNIRTLFFNSSDEKIGEFLLCISYVCNCLYQKSGLVENQVTQKPVKFKWDVTQEDFD